jgi:hypothetical protein
VSQLLLRASDRRAGIVANYWLLLPTPVLAQVRWTQSTGLLVT